MDYLDPIKKQTKKKHLMIMYALLGIAIAIATVITVYLVNGYSIDTKGSVIQNGLIYLDSKPESAEVFLNGEKQRGRTDSRLVVPEGNYDIELKRDGYRSWYRSLKLEGGSLRRLTYPRLIPEALETISAVSLPENPQMSTQSIDKRWLVMSFPSEPLKFRYVDLSRSVPQLQDFTLPVDIIDTTDPGSWRSIDWADDNKNFLAVYEGTRSKEYVMIDREKPENSRNLRQAFPTTNFSEAQLKNRRKDQVFMFNPSTGIVVSGNIATGETSLVQDKILQYVVFGDDSIVYITDDDKTDDMVEAMLKKGDKVYKLRSIKQSEKYLLDMSKLGGALVVGIGSPAENRVIVYNDPIYSVEHNDFSTIPVPTTVLRVISPVELTISADSSVIMTRGAEGFASHEFEADRSYTFKLDGTIDENQKMRWLDGQHALISINSRQHIFDFDGSNLQELVSSQQKFGAYADNKIDSLYTLIAQGESAEKSAYLMRTFMRTEADR